MLTPENNNIRNVPSDVSRSRNPEERRVPPPPRVNKEFKKILDRDEEPDDFDPTAIAEQKKIKKEKSIYSTRSTEDEVADAEDMKKTQSVKSRMNLRDDMSGNMNDDSPQPEAKTLPKPNPNASPFALYQQMAAKDKTPGWAADIQGNGDLPMEKNVQLSKKDKLGDRYSEERSDTGALNILSGGQSAQVVAINDDASGQITKIAELKEIVDQIVDKLYTLETTGKTDTVITIKNLALFENARVIITEFKSATKEFNLAFENLRPEAKVRLDENMESLRQNLQENGYARAIHIITTTTYVEHLRYGEIQSPLAKGDSQQEEKRERHQQKQSDKEEA